MTRAPVVEVKEVRYPVPRHDVSGVVLKAVAEMGVLKGQGWQVSAITVELERPTAARLIQGE